MTLHEVEAALAVVPEVARGRVLVVGFPATELPTAILDAGASVELFHQDLRAHRSVEPAFQSTYAPWLEAGDPFDAAMVLLPKSVEHTRMVLAMTRARLASGGPLVLVGHNDTGIRSAGRHLREFVGEPSVLDARRHCRALIATADGSAVPFDPTQWRARFEVSAGGRTFDAVSYPGVFSHGRLDQGTRLLLETLSRGRRSRTRSTDEERQAGGDHANAPATTDDAGGWRALDIGCGAGVVARWLTETGWDVEATDVDALALASAAETAPHARTVASDVYDSIDGAYDLIVSNPPFHAGSRTTTEAALRIVRESPAHLNDGGELWIVANRFLPYPHALQQAFGSFDLAHSDPAYHVYRAISHERRP